MLLVVHALLGVATVGASTHLVLWLRRYAGGKAIRKRQVVRFAWISMVLFAATFTAGSLAYPIYKVQVRGGYLDNPSAIAEQYAEPARAAEVAVDAGKVARWFDVKEHWAALGLMLTLACLLILRRWDPSEGRAAITPVVLSFAGLACATAWLAAIVGLVTSSYRAIGS